MSKKNVEWEWKKLGDVSNIYNGNSINEKIKKECYSNIDKGFPFIATKDVSFDCSVDYENGIRIPYSETHFKTAQKDTVLICAEGGSAGRKKCILNQTVCFGNKLFAIDSNKALLSGKFVFYYVHHDYFLIEFKKLMTGIIGGVSSAKFKEIPIPIPPLDEQERIVKVLDDAFEKIDAIKTTAETNLQNAKDLFQTTLANEFVVSKENNLWMIHNLEDIVSEDCPISYGIVQPGEHIEDGIPVVRPIDLKEKNLDSVDSLKRTSKKISDAYKRTILQGGEILMCVRGTTGTVSIASDDFKNCNVTRGIVPFHFGTKTFTSFMYYAFVSSFVSNQIQEQTRGTALKQINIKDLKEIKIPLPPLPIQKQIVAKLDSLSEKVKQLESNYKQVLADCDELKKSILKKAFNGEI